MLNFIPINTQSTVQSLFRPFSSGELVINLSWSATVAQEALFVNVLPVQKINTDSVKNTDVIVSMSRLSQVFKLSMRIEEK